MEKQKEQQATQYKRDAMNLMNVCQNYLIKVLNHLYLQEMNLTSTFISAILALYKAFYGDLALVP